MTDADPTSNPPPSNQIEWQDALWLLGMGVVFSMFYLSIAQDYRMFAGYTNYDNVLFGADHVDALNGWIGKHKGTHPLLPLVVVPLSNLFGSICGDYESGLSLLSGCIGGFAVAMFYGLLRMVVQRPASVAGTLLFGFSMNQMVFSGLPDTYVLVAISIIPSFMLLLRSLNTGQLNSVLWTAAGVLAFSITITTLAQFAVCLTAALLATQGVRLRSLTQGIGICICAIGIGTALVAVQYSFYPDSQLFFQPAVYNYEMQYLTPLIVEHPGAVADELIKSFWLFNIVGQDPLVVRHEPGLRVELIYYRAAVDYGWLEMAAVVPWLILYIRGAIRTLQDSARRPFLLATWVCVGSHLTLHSFFSTDELFLYAPHYTFIVLLTAISPSSTKGRLPLCGWLAVATLVGVANYRTHTEWVDRFGGPLPKWLLSDDVNWKYFEGTREPESDWIKPGFDDSGWKTGQTGFGYGDGDDRTILDMQDRFSTVYMRAKFLVEYPDQLADLIADINYDDGFVIYLNGHRIMSRNAPARVTHTSVATGDHEGTRYRRYHLPRKHVREGENTIAIVGLNRSLSSSDFSLAFRLSCTCSTGD